MDDKTLTGLHNTRSVIPRRIRKRSRIVGIHTVLTISLLAVGIVLYASDRQVPTLVTQGPPVVTVPGATPIVPADLPQRPAVPVTEVKSPAAPSHFSDQAIWALMISFLIQWLKKSPWFGWITPQTSARIKTQFGFLAAFLTAAGIHFAVSGSVLDGGGASITVTGLSINAFKDVAWQWAAQQAWYQAIIKEDIAGTLLTSITSTTGDKQWTGS